MNLRIIKFLKKRYLVLIILFLGTLLLSIKILDVPPGINGDEASIGLNSALISKTLKDENGNFLPLFFNTLGKSDWKQPITIYTTALFFKIFGISFFLLRFVSVIFCLLSATFLYILIDKYLGYREALIGLAIFFTTPIIIIQSHLALENIAPLPFVLLWLFFLLEYLSKSDSRFLIYSGISLGFSIYSYNGMRLISPILFLTSLIYVICLNPYKKIISDVFKFSLTFVILLLILIPLKNVYPGAIFGSSRPVKISSYQDFFLPIISSFDLSFLFLKGDSTPYHSTGRHGLFLLGILPFFLIGCLETFRRSNHLLRLSLLSFFATPILYSLVGSIYRGSRLLSFVPFLIVLSAAGLMSLLKKGLAYRLLTISLFVFLLFNISDFLIDYWFYYPSRVRLNFNPPLHQAFSRLKNKAEGDENVFIGRGLYERSYPASSFFEKVYFPKSIKKLDSKKNLPKKALILTTQTEDVFENDQNFKKEKLNDFYSIYEKQN